MDKFLMSSLRKGDILKWKDGAADESCSPFTYEITDCVVPGSLFIVKRSDGTNLVVLPHALTDMEIHMSHTKSFKPAFIFAGQAEPSTNAQAFATHAEAHKSAQRRFYSWTMPIDFTVIESDEPVNYRWDDELGDVMVNREEKQAA